MSQSLLRVSLLAAGLLSSPFSFAGSDAVDFDIPAASLEQSLNALARQASAQILFSGDSTAGKTAPALKGRFTPAQALSRLLGSSGLKAQERDEHTFIVVPGARADKLALGPHFVLFLLFGDQGF